MHNIFLRDFKKEYPIAEKGDGIYIIADGKRYLDSCGGVVAVSLGYNNPFIINKIKEQAENLCYAHTGSFINQQIIDLSNKLVSKLPSSFGKVYFCSGGSEANETAIKMARQYFVDSGKKKKRKIVSRMMSYHGSTMGCLSVTGNPDRQRIYKPLYKESIKIPPPYCYRCCFGKVYGSCSLECAEALREAIQKEGRENVAAFIAEPITGASCCALLPPKDYFKRIREICDENEVLLILDEVMTGIGRTGKWFAFEHFGIEPDIITLGKGLSSGYMPIGAAVCSNKIADAIKARNGVFVHGFTFSGHALAAAAGNAVIDYIEQNNLLDNINAKSERIVNHLKHMKCSEYLGEIRGKGFMLGVEIVKDKEAKKPFDRKTNLGLKIKRNALERGMITFMGTRMKVYGIEQGDHFMLAPHFISTDEELNSILAIFDEAVSKAGYND